MYRKKYIVRSVLCTAALCTALLSSETLIHPVSASTQWNHVSLVTEPTVPDTQNEDSGTERTYLEGHELKNIFQFSCTTASSILTNSNQNECYSPLSLYYALSLVSMGAEGETLRQFESLLGISDKSALASQCRTLYQIITENNTDNEEHNPFISPSQCLVANSLWMKQGASFQEPFIQTARDDFYSSLFYADFSAPETAQEMSSWIEKQTRGLLKPSIELSSEQVFSIINTVYLKDEWVNEFDSSNKKESPFFRTDGTSVPMDFMSDTSISKFFRGENFTRTELSLKGNGSMILLLPDEGCDPDMFLSSPELLNSALFQGENESARVTVTIPKFTIKSKYFLQDYLKQLGLTDAFTPAADFTSMTDSPVSLDLIRQETHMEINEHGVEAAAFTALVPLIGFPPEIRVELTCNRPFLYTVTARSGVPLFIGVYRGAESAS